MFTHVLKGVEMFNKLCVLIIGRTRESNIIPTSVATEKLARISTGLQGVASLIRCLLRSATTHMKETS